jgi:predicted aspartyl protease
MGNLRVPCRVAALGDGARSVDLPELLVDPGSSSTWISRSVLEGGGISAERMRRSFSSADGRTIARSIAFVVLSIGDEQTVDEVVLAEPGERQRLGARTLSGLRLRVDPIRKMLVPAGPAPAACA